MRVQPITPSETREDWRKRNKKYPLAETLLGACLTSEKQLQRNSNRNLPTLS